MPRGAHAHALLSALPRIAEKRQTLQLTLSQRHERMLVPAGRFILYILGSCDDDDDDDGDDDDADDGDDDKNCDDGKGDDGDDDNDDDDDDDDGDDDDDVKSIC